MKIIFKYHKQGSSNANLACYDAKNLCKGEYLGSECFLDPINTATSSFISKTIKFIFL